LRKKGSERLVTEPPKMTLLSETTLMIRSVHEKYC